VDDFALVSDTAYAAQNGGRIVRALLEIAISRKWANVTAVLMGMSKAIEKRLWPFDQPLKQFDLKGDIFYGLERWADEWSPAELAACSADDLGKLVHLNERHGLAILNAAKQFPSVRITYSLRPLGFDVLRIAVRVTPTFTWSTKVHGNAEPFWLWVEDHDALNILQLSHLIFRPTTESLDLDFVISIPDNEPPPAVTIRFVSDRWMGAEDEISIPLDTLVMPVASHSHSPRLDLPFLTLSTLHNPIVESIFANRLHNFNSIQTQSFWTLINTRSHSLLCAPVGSGKSMLIQVLVWYVPCTLLHRMRISCYCQDDGFEISGCVDSHRDTTEECSLRNLGRASRCIQRYRGQRGTEHWTKRVDAPARESNPYCYGRALTSGGFAAGPQETSPRTRPRYMRGIGAAGSCI
jgi:antiviral helicase SLH1